MRHHQNRYGRGHGRGYQGVQHPGHMYNQPMLWQNQPQVGYNILPPPVNINQPVPAQRMNGAPRGRQVGAAPVHLNRPNLVDFQNRGPERYAANVNVPLQRAQEPRRNQHGGGFAPMYGVPVEMRNPAGQGVNHQRFHPYQQDQVRTECKYDPGMSLEEAMNENWSATDGQEVGSNHQRPVEGRSNPNHRGGISDINRRPSGG